MSSRNSDATLVTRLGTFHANCPVQLQALKDKKGLNSRGALSGGGWRPQKQPERATEDASPTKVRCVAVCIWSENLTPMLSEDARCHWLGRDNVGYAMIKGN